MAIEGDYRLMADFRYALRQFYQFSRTTLARFGLTLEQYEVLLIIGALSDTKTVIGTLSERLQVKHHTAVSLVQKLADRKLVQKTRTGTDRRYVHLKLTAAGAGLLARLAHAHRDELRSRSPEMIRLVSALQA